MKPKTRKEREADKLFRTLYPTKESYVSDRFREWVATKIVKPVVYTSGHKGWCLTCGKPFPCEATEKTVICPHCGREAMVQKTKKKHEYSISYLQELTYHGEFQIINTYTLQESYKEGYAGHYWIERVYTWLINDKDDQYLFSAGLKMFCYKFDNPWYQFDDGLHMRKQSAWSRYSYHDGWRISGVYPHSKLHPYVRKFGLKASTCCVDAYNLIRHIRYNNKSETLLKIGQIKLLEYSVNHSISSDEWKKILTALRHGFQFKKLDNVGDWFDHLSILAQLGLDSSNPKYICPENFEEEHNRLNERLRRKRERERRERDRQRLEEQMRKDKEAADPNSKKNKDYRKRLGKMLGVTVEAGDLILKPLQTVKEFMEAGNTLHHCVYTNGYYKKENCLIIAACVSGQLAECIEINTKSWEILQCRGNHNQPSEFHDRIMTTMQSNMGKFRRACV